MKKDTKKLFIKIMAIVLALLFVLTLFIQPLMSLGA